MHSALASWALAFAPAPVQTPSHHDIQIVLEGEQACSEFDRLEGRVKLLLANSPPESPAVRATITSARDQAASSMRVRLELARNDAKQSEASSAGERHELEGSSCDALTDGVALLIAFAVDPLVLDHVSRPGEAPQTLSQTPDESPSLPPPTVSTTQAQPPQETDAANATVAPPAAEIRAVASPDDRRWAANLQSTLGCCVTPALNFGLHASTTLSVRPGFAFDMGARHAFRRVQVVEGGTGGIGVQSSAARTRFCARRARQHLWLACLGLEAGALIASSSDVEPANKRAAFWGATTAGAGYRWPADSRVALALDAEAWVALTRPSFKFPGVTGAYRPERAGARAMIGAALNFGGPVTRKRHKAATNP